MAPIDRPLADPPRSLGSAENTSSNDTDTDDGLNSWPTSNKWRQRIGISVVVAIVTIIFFFCHRERIGTYLSSVPRLETGKNQRGSALQQEPAVFLTRDLMKSLVASAVVISLPDFALRRFVPKPQVEPHPAEHLLQAINWTDYRIIWGNESQVVISTEQGPVASAGDLEAEDAQNPEPNSKKGKRSKTSNLAETGPPEVEAADIESARRAVIRPLAPIVEDQRFGARPVALYNFLISYMQDSQVDAEPLIADFGCGIGPLLAAGHDNSTVLCFSTSSDKGRDLAPGPEDGSSKTDQEATIRAATGGQNRGKRKRSLKDGANKQPAPGDDTSVALPSSALRTAKNLFPVVARGGFLGSPFSLIYKSCHIFSVSFLIPDLIAAAPSASRNCDQIARLSGNLLRMSKTTFLSVPLKCHRHIRSVVEELNLQSHYRLDLLGVVLPDSFGEIEKRKIDMPLSEEEQPTLILRVVMLRHTRPSCQKLWGKPKVGKRDVAFSYKEGLVTIEIVDSMNKKILRRIHPLSYIVSFNVDTLISMGVPRSTSQRLLGQMIQVPFYHDPFPQNWVLAGGGRVLRIDKDDKNYLAHKSESQHYWARSTRGYLHLLGTHLCLKVANGLPAIMLREPCRATCLSCATQCDMTVKAQGQPVCEHCQACGSCVVTQSTSRPAGADRVRACPSDRPYGGNIWAKGRDFWKRWEAADQRSELPT